MTNEVGNSSFLVFVYHIDLQLWIRENEAPENCVTFPNVCLSWQEIERELPINYAGTLKSLHSHVSGDIAHHEIFNQCIVNKRAVATFGWVMHRVCAMGENFSMHSLGGRLCIILIRVSGVVERERAECAQKAAHVTAEILDRLQSVDLLLSRRHRRTRRSAYK
jgi:hypothetical protein